MNTVANPLSGPPPEEVPLDDPPLIRVIAQLRFPPIASIETQRFIGPFQEAIRSNYPTLRPERSDRITLSPGGITPQESNVLWRFHDTTDAWRATLAPNFLALETSNYQSRDDFLSRLRETLSALKQHINPGRIDRLGIRYIDRIELRGADNITGLIRPEVAGILGTPLVEHARHALSESVFDLPDQEARVTARWGLVPSKGTVDPAALDAIDAPSWLLDLDAFSTEIGQLEVDSVLNRARALAERIYSIFRWAVTDAFLRRYGGQP